jgi:myo-inositol 2-dehydrogenase/D-chiro-inositol 1-dehydrogenase
MAESKTGGMGRRGFLKTAAGAAATAGLLIVKPGAVRGLEANSKVEVGIIGGGHRGNFIGDRMKKHGGFEIHAVADYFPEVSDKLGEKYGVDKARRFSGLSGYKKVLESGVEALAILDVPCFYPEQAKTAVDAGCHVYIAKPVAVDVPGTLAIGAAAA